jgi:glycosyltransferase involved in cell wall biosynthesis
MPLQAREAARRGLKILIATDAWHPQVNGVVRVLELLVRELEALGQEVRVLEPGMFRTVPMPTYPEIRLALNARGRTRRIIDGFAPDAMHIATEGPIGWAARNYCLRARQPFTTSFHTRFPEYLHARTRFPTRLSYRLIRHFHRPSSALLVTTPYLKKELEGRGFRNVKTWLRGVDVEQFQPRPKDWLTLPRPIFLYVGRVAIEKNLAAFLSLDLPGSKLVVGDGPQLQSLKFRFPNVYFVGTKLGEELARYYAASDVFVFPSRTDTYGLVILEALASGLPVAAFPVPGPADIIGNAPVGCLDWDLKRAALSALEIPPEECRKFALGFSWQACALQFLDHINHFAPAEPESRTAALDYGLSEKGDDGPAEPSVYSPTPPA